MIFNPRWPLAGMMIALPLLLSSAAAFAQAGVPRPASEATEQQTLDPVTARIDEIEAEDRRIVQSQGPSDAFGFAPNTPQFQLSTNREDGEATLSLAAEVSRTGRNYDPVSGDDRRASWTSRVYLRGIAPLDEDDEEAPRFVNLADPLNGSRITIGFVHYISRYTLRRDDLQLALADRTTIMRDCLRQTVTEWQHAAPRTPEQIALADAYYGAFNAQLESEQRPEPALLLTNRHPAYGDVPDAVKNRCRTGIAGSPHDMLEMAAIYGEPVQVERILRAVTGNAPTLFFGAEATVSQQDNSFLDRTSFTIDDSETHRGYALSAFAGVIGGSGNWSLRGGLSYARSYEEQDEVNLCRPVAGSTDTQCLTGPDGPPTRTSSAIFSVEGRARVNTPIGNIGFAPVLAIDLEEGDYTVNVPIYLARNSDGLLTGGIQVGYASAKDDISFGFFVGVPFNIFFR